MPLLWSRAEFLKLLIAGADRRPLELLRSVENHFSDPGQCRPTLRHWRSDVQCRALERGLSITFEDTRPFMLHLGFDGWRRIHDYDSAPHPSAYGRRRCRAQKFKIISDWTSHVATTRGGRDAITLCWSSTGK